jgi:hypothetical protein
VFCPECSSQLADEGALDEALPAGRRTG